MIAILLATYNSEKFIRAQIDSILNQTNTDWKLVIRDDISNDKTICILQEYVSKYPDKIFILDNHKETKRAYLNFVELMKNVESEYYMFCDHDDVWLPDKIQLSISRMKTIEEKESDKPIIVHTDMKVVDQNLNVINNSFWRYSNLLPDHVGFLDMVLCNSANGCTMMFNNKAKLLALKNIKYASMHDMLLNQSVAACDGIISAIYKPTVLYRQHVNNVVGAKERNWKFYINKIKYIPLIIKDNVIWYKNADSIKHISVFDFVFTKLKIFFYKRTAKYDKYEQS